MSTSESVRPVHEETPAPSRAAGSLSPLWRFLRYGFPPAVLVLAALVIAFFWLWPDEEWPRLVRVVGTWITSMLSGLLLAGWLLLLSGLRWWQSLGVVVLPVVAVGLVKDLKFDGDMAPVITWRWQRSPGQGVDTPRLTKDSPPVLADVKGDDFFFEYRGRLRDGVVEGPALTRDWAKQPPRLLWKHDCGGGYSGFVVTGNLAITLEQRDEDEVIAAYDTATGEERWIYPYHTAFAEALGGPGPRATPTIAGDLVYSLGAMGDLVCLQAADGKEKWSKKVLAESENLPWGMSGSPLVVDNLVIVNPGVQKGAPADRGLVAYDRETGKLVWSKGNAQAAYASPMLATLGDKRQVLIFDAGGLAGHDPATGDELWRFKWETHQGINAAQPLVLDGDRVFISSAYGHGGALLQVALADGKWSAKPLWESQSLRCKFSSPVFYKGYLYGLDEGLLVCVDPKDGKRRWKGNRYGHGEMLLAGDLLVILSESGDLAVADATPEEFRELDRMAALHGKTWNYPALAGGKLYVRNDREMACYDLRAKR
jgi:outer membrane protein assembly factor BamB